MPIDNFDFWYAVKITKVVHSPKQPLETFGTTRCRFYLVSELLDEVDQCRIRTGLIISERPVILTPKQFANQILEGFGEAARQYVEWLRQHNELIRILRYGLQIRKEDVHEENVSGNINEIAERLAKAAANAEDLTAAIIGSDTHWEVSLLKFFRDYIEQSAPINLQQIRQREYETNLELMREIETEFRIAEKNPDRIPVLGKKLQNLNLMEKYEDRFLELVKKHGSR
ncbi:MAG: hypothetical protein D6820_05255 [Lentisphaerae bacterium]|nr:MAG: hypothetical protein D6820_05255 [Lentisphaerota bacterium]